MAAPEQMITIFSIPKAPVGHTRVIQENAVRSWKALENCEVILFGDEPGLADFAAELGVKHFPDIACNELGTPLRRRSRIPGYPTFL